MNESVEQANDEWEVDSALTEEEKDLAEAITRALQGRLTGVGISKPTTAQVSTVSRVSTGEILRTLSFEDMHLRLSGLGLDLEGALSQAAADHYNWGLISKNEVEREAAEEDYMRRFRAVNFTIDGVGSASESDFLSWYGGWTFVEEAFYGDWNWCL